jgi:raffinose/stachyose/melibiose transport system permease protein
VIGAWTFFGFCVLIYLAAIQSNDPSLYEAAELDGAGWWLKFRHITTPLLRGTTLFLGLYAAIEAMRFFDLIWVTTQGGPGYATEVLTTHVYKTFFLIGDFGYAASLSVVLLVIVLALSAGSFWLLKRS